MGWTSSSRAPADDPAVATGAGRVGGCCQVIVAAACRMASSRSAAVRPGRRGHELAGVGGVQAVEAEQGVEVDRAACLVFGGFAVADPDRGDQPVPAVAARDRDERDAAGGGRAGPGGVRWLAWCAATVPRRCCSTRRGRRGRSSPGTAAVPAWGHRGGGGWCRPGAARAGRSSASRRAWHGWGRQVQRVLSAQVCRSTGRAWTGPKEGAVKVANTAGWVATSSGMPLPPISPARMSWNASRR